MTERELLETIVNRLNSIETNTKQELAEIKASMATKDELAAIRTNMATKDELAEIRTNMATKDELARVREIVVRIENDHGQKLGALFDGYTQNAARLERIEKSVAKHEETLLTKVK